MIRQRPASVEIVEVGPRDGLQNEPEIVSAEARIAFITRMHAAGLRRIEAASFVNPKRVPQMADAEDVVRAAKRLPGIVVSGLVLNERGFERAMAAEVDEITFVIVASETFSLRNQGAGIAGMLEQWARLSPQAYRAGVKRSVTVAAGFGCPFEGEVPVDRVTWISGAVAEIGTDEISLADTIGVAAPHDVEERFGAVMEAVPEMAWRAHFHNTRNTGYANADAAIRVGVTALDSSLGGIGGCPFAPGATGNIATEDLAYMLERCGVATGLDFDKLRDANAWLAEQLGKKLPGQLARVPPFPGDAPREAPAAETMNG